jgi:hypothetical protein
MIDPRTDLSDEAMALRWGHVINEIPELWYALRKFEIENRPAVTSVGFAIKSDWVSVQRSRDVTRIRVGNARS